MGLGLPKWTYPYNYVVLLYTYIGGQLEEVVKSHHLKPKQVLRVFYATCSAVAHMHSQHPPIMHRDLKVCPPPPPHTQINSYVIIMKLILMRHRQSYTIGVVLNVHTL